MTYTLLGALSKSNHRMPHAAKCGALLGAPASLINRIVLGAIVVVGLGLSVGPAAAEPDDRVFTVAKYPVDASAANAVTAKRDGLVQGRKAAFRSLLKRLVPAATYDQLGELKMLDPERFINSVAVRSEETSSTQYVATLDFSFDQTTVRSLLRQKGVAFVDQQAPLATLIPIYSPPPAGGTRAMASAAGSAAWRATWAGLDLENSLTPLQLADPASEPNGDAVTPLLAADPAAVAELGSRMRTAYILIAHAQPLPASNELSVTIAGQDAVGRFAVNTRYRLDEEDFRYSLELAAVIAQGVIEGRWKSLQTGPQSAAGGFAGGSAAALRVMAEFNNLGQWQRQQQVLADTPGVRNMQIGSLSGRSASIDLDYPGGGEALQAALAPQGLTLENINGFWILR